jgi:CBS domain-containing protein
MQAKHMDESTYCVNASDTVAQALKLMAEASISALLVKDGDRYVGIYTERDYARKGELAGRKADATLIKEVMTEKMITVAPDTSVDQCVGLMLKYRIRHLPVVENEHIVGLISMRDVVQEVLTNKDATIAGLENYIMGSNFAT